MIDHISVEILNCDINGDDSESNGIRTITGDSISSLLSAALIGFTAIRVFDRDSIF